LGGHLIGFFGRTTHRDEEIAKFTGIHGERLMARHGFQPGFSTSSGGQNEPTQRRGFVQPSNGRKRLSLSERV
jgi:hypothetical protein